MTLLTKVLFVIVIMKTSTETKVKIKTQNKLEINNYNNSGLRLYMLVAYFCALQSYKQVNPICLNCILVVKPYLNR